LFEGCVEEGVLFFVSKVVLGREGEGKYHCGRWRRENRGCGETMEMARLSKLKFSWSLVGRQNKPHVA
jgi:hypothetical protein